VHCSVLGDKALRSAINDYLRKTHQESRVEVEHGRVIDSVLKITDHDIEEAVLDGAWTLEAVQQKTKVGTGDPSCIPEVEQLIRFYQEKHFGKQ
jgi:NAD(P)H-nitrite reductase large subunit